MATVKKSRESRHARHELMDERGPEHVQSSGDLLIKQLAQKQLNTNVTLEEQLQNEKKFEHGFLAVNKLTAGTSSLKEFVDRQEDAEKKERFEIKNDTLCETQTTASYSNSTSSISWGSRQERELAFCVKPGSVETQLYHFAMRNSRTADVPPVLPADHPDHQLAAAADMLSHPSDPHALANTLRRKRRQIAQASQPPAQVHYKPPDPNFSLWDAIEKPIEVKRRCEMNVKMKSCKAQTLYTVKDGKIVELNSGENERIKVKPEILPCGQAFVSGNLPDSKECLDATKKLSDEEIRQLPRFQNYQRGEVSRTLYIKNLSRDITETELALLFNKYQEINEQQIIFRLMTGKMRGQAFVTFSSAELAKSALEALNGSVIKGKPIIIQFGRQQ